LFAWASSAKRSFRRSSTGCRKVSIETICGWSATKGQAPVRSRSAKSTSVTAVYGSAALTLSDVHRASPQLFWLLAQKMTRVGEQFLCVTAQHLRSISCRIDTERHKMYIRFFQGLLQFTHARADHRARPGTTRVDKIRDPDFPR